MTEKIKGMYAVAQRIVNAENNFIEVVMELSGCTKAEAEKVLSVYRKLKMVKIDLGIGRINVKHGAYLDFDVIQNAIAYTD